MSQNIIQLNDYKYIKNPKLSRSSEPIKKYQSKIAVSNKAGRFSTISLIKQTESSLTKENQDFYKFRYSLQDNADDTNTIFFDANSRKFRIRTEENKSSPRTLKDTFNKISIIKVGTNNKKDYNSRNNISTRNKQINEKIGLKTENISNKIKPIKFNEKNVRNSETRKEIIKQLKKEKDELIGSNKKNQQSYNMYNNDSNSLKREPEDPSISFKNKNINQNINNLSINKLGDKNQKTKSNNNNEEENPLNKKLNSNIKLSNKKDKEDHNNPNISDNSNKKNNLLKDLNENQQIKTSQKTEEKTLVIIPGQTIEKKSKVENIENPTEELIENPDGTINSILKQTKITTITENTPIEENKIKSGQGSPKLPLYKQKMTHIYKTVTSVNQKNSNKKLNNKNKNHDSNKILNKINNDKNNNTNNNNNVKNNNDNNIVKKNNNNNNKINNNNDKNNNKKEKENKINEVKDSLNKITKGKNSEENIENLSQLLLNMNEKDKKEYLEKLRKDPNNANLLKKLENIIGKNKNNANKNNLNKDSKKQRSNKKSPSKSPSNKKHDTGFKSLKGDNVEIKNISPLKFDGLFLDLTKYDNQKREKNPFEGPSPYFELYKERIDKIRQKISSLDSNDLEKSKK